MAMGLQQQQQQQQHQGSPPMFPGDFVEYGQQYDPNTDPSRQPRDAGRNGRYRRPRSSSLDDDSRFTTAAGGGGGGEGQRTPDSDPALRDAVLAQAPHSQQRVVPTGPGARGGQPRAAGPRNGPPSMANASQNRRSQPPPPVQSQLPPYMGDNPDEWSPATREAAAGAGAGGYSRRRTERHARRQSSAGARAPGSSDTPSSSSIPQMSGGGSPRDGLPESLTPPRVSSLQQQQQVPNPGGLRPPSPPGGGLGDDISRIQSPSISKSVLEPLQRKMLEYHNLMADAQSQMAQFDEELRVLEERRRLAEQRFVDAKTKHDEYERQHLDVERALRGDFSAPQPPSQQKQQPQPHQSQQHMHNNSPPRTAPRPASSIMSYDDRPMSGHSSVPRKGKLRFSLFGR